MSIALRALLIGVSLVTFFYMIRKIRHSKLQIEFAIFWILFSLLILLISIFPGIVHFFVRLLKIQSPVNFVYLCIIFILIIKVFMMTIEISDLQYKIKELTQKIAIDNKEEGDSPSSLGERQAAETGNHEVDGADADNSQELPKILGKAEAGEADAKSIEG